MGHGTIVKVYASRIHKSNADQVVEESRSLKAYVERTLLAMAASTGEVVQDGVCVPWYEHVAREVPGLLEEYQDACFKETMAQLILDNPEDADDDYDTDNLSQTAGSICDKYIGETGNE
jgi:hypothetical protein